jgi:hypothetical protein
MTGRFLDTKRQITFQYYILLLKINYRISLLRTNYWISLAKIPKISLKKFTSNNILSKNIFIFRIEILMMNY